MVEDNEICEREVCFDLETTGLDIRDDQPVQVGAKSGDFEFKTLVKPDKKIHPRASAVTGIYDETVRHAQSFGVMYRTRFKPWLMKLPGTSLHFISHNGFRFDWPLWFNSMTRAGLDIAKELKECRITRFYDTLPISQMHFPPRHNLKEMFKRCVGEDKEMLAHDALGDCVALELLIQAPVFQFNQRKSKSSCGWSTNGLLAKYTKQNQLITAIAASKRKREQEDDDTVKKARVDTGSGSGSGSNSTTDTKKTPEETKTNAEAKVQSLDRYAYKPKRRKQLDVNSLSAGT